MGHCWGKPRIPWKSRECVTELPKISPILTDVPSEKKAQLCSHLQRTQHPRTPKIAPTMLCGWVKGWQRTFWVLSSTHILPAWCLSERGLLRDRWWVANRWRLSRGRFDNIRSVKSLVAIIFLGVFLQPYSCTDVYTWVFMAALFAIARIINKLTFFFGKWQKWTWLHSEIPYSC